MATQAQRTATTRRALIDAATRLFTEHGYHATSTESVVREAGVTRGALYHHFADKRDLFLAVYHDVHRRIAEQNDELIRTGGGGAASNDPLGLFLAGLVAFLGSVADNPSLVRITVSEAPGALGADQWHELDRQYADSTIGFALQMLVAAGVLRADVPIKEWTIVLNGAVNEAASTIADAAATADDLPRFAAVLDSMLTGLRAQTSGQG